MSISGKVLLRSVPSTAKGEKKNSILFYNYLHNIYIVLDIISIQKLF